MPPKTAKKSPALKLPVKVGRNYLYLDKNDLALKVGPSGAAQHPADLALKLPKGERRRMRKALSEAGHRELVLESLAHPSHA